jgi:hypothetical protein
MNGVLNNGLQPEDMLDGVLDPIQLLHDPVCPPPFYGHKGPMLQREEGAHTPKGQKVGD